MEAIEISVQAVAKQPGSQAEGAHRNYGHGPDFVHQKTNFHAFEKDPPHHDEKIAHGVDHCDVLHPLGHVGNGRGEARQGYRWHDEEDGTQKRLLQGGGE